MNAKQKSFITRLNKKIIGMDRQQKVMEIDCAILRLYENMKWTRTEIFKLEKYLFSNEFLKINN